MKRLWLAALAALLISAANAATTPNSIVTPQTPNRGIVRFLQGTDSPGVAKTLYTAGANGSRCYGAIASTTDGSTAHVVTMFLTSSAVNYPMGAVNVPLNSGFANGVPAVSLMNAAVTPGLPVDQYGNPYIQLISGDTLTATYATALTAATAVTIIIACSDF